MSQNEHDDIDDARAATIDQRIGQTFAFLGDVIDDPLLLDTIPDGSRLAFRDVSIGDFGFRLTAYRPPGSNERWSAPVTGYTEAGSRNGSQTTARHQSGPARRGKVPDAQMRKTAKAALDALEVALRGRLTVPA